MPRHVCNACLGQGHLSPLPGHIVECEPGPRAAVRLGGRAQCLCRFLVPTTASSRRRYSKIRSTESEARCQRSWITCPAKLGAPLRRSAAGSCPLRAGERAQKRKRRAARICCPLTLVKAQPRSETACAANGRPQRCSSAESSLVQGDSCLKREPRSVLMIEPSEGAILLPTWLATTVEIGS